MAPGQGPRDAPEGTVVRLSGPARPEDLEPWCDRVRRLLQPGHIVVCTLGGACSDLATVDALARLHLAACRAGSKLRLSAPGSDLERLVRWLGLPDLLEPSPPTSVEIGRQSEPLEQPGGEHG